MMCINDEQRQKITGRLAKIGLLFSLSVINPNADDTVETLENAKESALHIGKLIKEINGYYMPIAYFYALNGLLDAIKDHKNEESQTCIPYGILNVIEAILSM